DTLLVQRLIRITDVESRGDQTGGQKLSALSMAPQIEEKVFAFGPHVRAAGHSRRLQSPRLRFDGVVGKNAKRRNDVFSEVLVLIVTPDQNKVRLEFIKRAANLIEPIQQRLPMRGGSDFALIAAVLFPHLRRPVRRI